MTLQIYVEIGRNTRVLRRAAGFTQRTLAAKIGMSRGSIANMEVGRQRMPVHTLVLLADAIGCSVLDLLAPTVGYTTLPGGDDVAEAIMALNRRRRADAAQQGDEG